MSKPLKSQVFLALDVNDKKEAFQLVERWHQHVAGFKVGPRLGFKFNQQEWKFLSKKGGLFVDYKFFDIPSTVESSVQVAFDSGASFCTVHAVNGSECLKRLARLERRLNQIRPFKILVVTLLTSFDQMRNTLPLARGLEPSKIVSNLVNLVFESGLTGVVCSAKEVKNMKKSYPQGVFVTPGIRFAKDSADDQKRVSSPLDAWADGASYLVMGRSLINAQDFNGAVKKLEQAWLSV